MAADMPENMTLEEALKRIDQLEAANAALKGAGRINREVKNSVFLDMFRRKEFFGGESGKPELTAKILYVKNSDGIIEEYIRFSQVFDEQRLKFKDEPEKVYPEVFKICAAEGILTEYLSKHRAEVEKIVMTMVSPEYAQKASQRTAGIKSAIDMGRAAGQTDDFIREYLIKKFGITFEYAQNCLDAEWEEDNIFV